jgi:hypothetical protein
MNGAVRQVLVVVPARDEEALVGGCLDSLEAAVGHLQGSRHACRVRVVVALDTCTDATAAVVAQRPWVHAVRVDLGVVGAVRAAGVAAGLRLLAEAGSVPPGERVWLAHTDADTRVPLGWLTSQVALAARGVDLVVGSAEPDPLDLEPTVLAVWHARHVLGEGHGFVHGASIGVRLSSYAEVGGFRPLAVHEDVDLVRRVRATGAVWRSTDRTRVRTSGRRQGRLSGGFADALAAIDPAV